MSMVKDLPVMYQNKRTLIVDASSSPNFGMDHQFVLWDKVMGFEMGWADLLPDGTLKGFAVDGQHSIEFSGKTFSELAVNALKIHKWNLTH